MQILHNKRVNPINFSSWGQGQLWHFAYATLWVCYNYSCCPISSNLHNCKLFVMRVGTLLLLGQGVKVNFSPFFWNLVGTIQKSNGAHCLPVRNLKTFSIFIRPFSDGTYYGMVMSVCPGLRPSVHLSGVSICPSISPSVTVFGTFLLHPFTYWAEILHMTLF